MNNILELKGNRFIQASKTTGGGGAAMNSKKTVTSEHLTRLRLQIEQIRDFWKKEQKPFEGSIISVYYNKIAAKSNRIGGLFKGQYSNSAVVGIKFNKEKNKHIITYFLDIEDLNKSIDLLIKTNEILMQNFEGSINKETFDNKNVINKHKFKHMVLSMSTFKQVIADASYIDSFEIEKPTMDFKQSIVTLYNVKKDTKALFQKIGIDILNTRILDNQTVYLDEKQVELLFEKVPYLVSMATADLSKLSPDDFINDQQDMISIPSPTIEPTIGVIDTLFDKRVYFNEWVEYHEMIAKEIPKNSNDYRHGTAVSSIIVDGARLNPWLDDGCGRFRVRHFGVAVGAEFSSFTMVKQIKEIILNNRDIKVWNISLGSNQEINDNFISAEASVLDQIQFENNDIIFVVAGTNKPNEDVVKIGSPADSINSLVVNSVTKKGLSTRYSRKGIVLSFFAKPDVSYYGGSEEQYIRVCEPLGAANVAGTSFAAPWIARKLSYLIDILGLNREVAKAMIIDAARGWNERPSPEEIALYGHGIVPIRIEDIIHTEDDEIKFIVSDISEKWNTYNYHFPVPLKDDKYPYIARATMCYFPLCDRAQGVDYTNTELNLQFGRIQDNGELNDIKGDRQNRDEILNSEKNYLLEKEARKQFRKWDNVKYTAESVTKKMIPKNSYTNKNWGMEIKTNNRLNPSDGEGIRFGVVVTLKEMNGINRIDEFIKNCTSNRWLVNVIDVENKIDFHQKINEEIELG